MQFMILAQIREGKRPCIPDAAYLAALPVANDFVALMQACWNQTPELRPSFRQVAEALQDIMSKVQLFQPHTCWT